MVCRNQHMKRIYVHFLILLLGTGTAARKASGAWYNPISLDRYYDIDFLIRTKITTYGDESCNIRYTFTHESNQEKIFGDLFNNRSTISSSCPNEAYSIHLRRQSFTLPLLSFRITNEQGTVSLNNQDYQKVPTFILRSSDGLMLTTEKRDDGIPSGLLSLMLHTRRHTIYRISLENEPLTSIGLPQSTKVQLLRDYTHNVIMPRGDCLLVNPSLTRIKTTLTAKLPYMPTHDIYKSHINENTLDFIPVIFNLDQMVDNTWLEMPTELQPTAYDNCIQALQSVLDRTYSASTPIAFDAGYPVTVSILPEDQGYIPRHVRKNLRVFYNVSSYADLNTLQKARRLKSLCTGILIGNYTALCIVGILLGMRKISEKSACIGLGIGTGAVLVANQIRNNQLQYLSNLGSS